MPNNPQYQKNSKLKLNKPSTLVEVTNLYKNFDLPHEVGNNLKQKILNPFHRTRIEKQEVLKGVNLKVKEGDFFGIVGRNGSGKSTLLKLIAQIYTPTSGNVHVDGVLVPFIELGVGFNPELTGRENVYLNGAMLGFNTKEVDSMYKDIVEFAELEDFMDQKLKNYSSGMQVRLAFSVAIKAKGDILLLDEVLAVGDESFQRKCFNYFKQLKKEGKTVILVTHSMQSIREFCTKALFLNEGKVEYVGDPEEAARQYSMLFIEESTEKIDKEEQTESKDSKRWGSGEARMISPKITSKPSEGFIRISIKLKSKTNLRVFPGFSIKTLDGITVTGLNSKRINPDGVSLAAGKESIVQWEIQNILSSGDYKVSLSLQLEDGKELDFRDDLLNLSIFKENSSIFPATAESKLIQID